MTNINYSLFLGCMIPNRYPGIELATRKSFSKLGINLVDIEGASCCPAPGVMKSFDKSAWYLIAARNLALAEQLNRDILTLCNGCYGSLYEANELLKTNSSIRQEANETLEKFDLIYRGIIDVKHFVPALFSEIGIERITERVERPLPLKVAIHYGCHLIRSEAYKKLDISERPIILDKLVESLGATSIDYDGKIACCGAGGGVRSALINVSLRMLNEKLISIRRAEADCIVNACPFCHLQFDRGQLEIRNIYGITYEIPVLHYSQILGLALGISPDELGLQGNFTPVQSLFEKMDLTREVEG